MIYIKVLSLCDGMSCGQIALDKLGIKVDKYYASEVKDIGIKVTKYNYPNTIHIGDANKVSYKDGVLHTQNGDYNVGNIDLVMFGSPCFVGDTLVLTQEGYKNISNIKIGDYVLSHDNKMHKVVNWGITGTKKIWNINAMGSDKIETTDNHKFFVRKMSRTYDKNIRRYKRQFDTPRWIETKELSSSYYLGYAINNESKLPNWNGVDYWKHWKIHHKQELDLKNENFWYIVGRWLGDGWLIKNRKGKYRSKYNGIKICCNKNNVTKLQENLAKIFNYTKTEERTVVKYQISNMELSHFLSQFGDGAKNKFIPKFVMDLPCELLSKLIEGYFDSDGYYDISNNSYSCISTSRALIYGIGQCIAKVYHRPFSVTCHVPPATKIIEGRTVNQNPYWILRFKKEVGKQDKAFFENGYMWLPIHSVIETEKFEEVYDITVEDSHSFTANGVIAHNCQTFSIAMKSDLRVGLANKEKSGLFLECHRILKEVNPTYFLMENVARMKQEDKDFITKMMGVEPIRINSKLVSAQLRDRLYWTNIPNVTIPADGGVKLQDILTSGFTDREKARALLVSDSRPLVTKSRMLHRYRSTGFTTLIWEEKDNDETVRYMNQTELERCQTVPNGYTSCLTRNEAADVLGDGWTVDVIAHILKSLVSIYNDRNEDLNVCTDKDEFCTYEIGA